jgi:TRAP-type C4-dicarboxylate transport system permease small subunit
MELVELQYTEAVDQKEDLNAWDVFSGKVLVGLATLALIGLTGIIAYDVAARSLFNAPTRWGYEIGKYLLAVSVLFGAAHTMAIGQMIRVDIIYTNLSQSVQTKLDVLGALCGFLFSIVLVSASARLAWQSWVGDSRSLDLDIPLYLPQSLVTFASITLAIQCMVQFFRSVKRSRAQQ